MSADLKAIQERAEKATKQLGLGRRIRDVDALLATNDRAALLEHIARQSEVVRMLTEATEGLALIVASPSGPCWCSTGPVAEHSEPCRIARAALKAAAEGRPSNG